jgi:hypothetical protein
LKEEEFLLQQPWTKQGELKEGTMRVQEEPPTQKRSEEDPRDNPSWEEALAVHVSDHRGLDCTMCKKGGNVASRCRQQVKWENLQVQEESPTQQRSEEDPRDNSSWEEALAVHLSDHQGKKSEKVLALQTHEEALAVHLSDHTDSKHEEALAVHLSDHQGKKSEKVLALQAHEEALAVHASDHTDSKHEEALAVHLSDHQGKKSDHTDSKHEEALAVHLSDHQGRKSDHTDSKHEEARAVHLSDHQGKKSDHKDSKHCTYCKKKNHNKSECFKLKTCTMCRKKGHVASRCRQQVKSENSTAQPALRLRKKSWSGQKPLNCTINNVNSEDRISADRAFVTIHVSEESSIQCLYDTGAAASILQPAAFRLAQKHKKIKCERIGHNIRLLNASGQPMPVSGVYDIEFFLDGRKCTGPFVVSPDAASNIIGMNLIKKYSLKFDTFRNQVSFDQHASTQAIALPDEEWYIYVSRSTKIQPQEARLVTCYLQSANGERLRDIRQFIGHMDLVSVAATTNDFGNFQVHMPNASHSVLDLPRGTKVGRAEPLDNWQVLSETQQSGMIVSEVAQEMKAGRRTHTKEEQRAIKEQLKQALSPHLDRKQRKRYLRMLSRKHEAFSANPCDLGEAKAGEHTIELKNQEPIYVQQYRLPQDHLEMIRKNVLGWLEAGVVEKANSRFNFPIFCVPKKGGGGLRCVLDYRQLNAKSVMDKYSIRTVEECLEKIGASASTVFSCLDLTSGFWQLRLAKDSRPYTAFTIPGIGQFQWCMSPMGLHGTPASFSRLMDLIMADAQNVISFIDDVLVHSRTHNDHIRHLENAIDRLQKAGLKLNPRKCIFGAREVEYLGHTVSGNGIKPGKDKVKALAETTPPTQPKQLKGFIGLANYFRGYIPRFAQRAGPLFKLTRQDSPWKGGNMPEEALRSFNDLKAAITSRPLLAFPNRMGHYHLYVDASLGDDQNMGGLGAVLTQEDSKGKQHPIGFASRRLLDHERNYPAFLAELAAACYGMDFFHHHLVGRRFTLHSDHKPLTKLSKTHTRTLARLSETLRELNPEFEYIEGRDNVVADFLSRYAEPSETASQACEITTVTMVDTSPERLRKLQQKDPILKVIWEKGHQLYKKTPAQFVDFQHQMAPGKPTRTYRLYNGVLQVFPSPRKGFMVSQPSVPKIAVPEGLREELIREAHSSWVGGHGGIFKTSERLRQQFWWPTMDKDIQKFINKCEPCQRTTDKGTLPPLPLQPLPETTRPNQRVHIDLFGPLKSSSNKNHYVLVITDAFTKLAKVVPIADKGAKTVTQAMLDRYIYIFGVPQLILSDQGNEFCSQFQNILWNSLDIEHNVTSPYHPRTNASAEVFNKTLAHYLATAIVEAESSTLDWELYLGPLMFSYNTAVHKSTKVSPFQATFGYDPRVPLWEGMQHPLDEELQGDGSFADHLARIRQTQHSARKIVYQNNQHARQEYQDQHDKHKACELPSFRPGDLVWVKNNQRNWPNPKLGPKWEKGTIIERKSHAVYKVRRDERKRRKIITMNAQQLKPRSMDRATDEETEEDETTDEETEEDEMDSQGSPSDEESEPGWSEPDHPKPSKPEAIKPSRYNLRSRKEQQVGSIIAAVAENIDIPGMTPEELIRLLSLGFVMSGFSSSMQWQPQPALQTYREQTGASDPSEGTSADLGIIRDAASPGGAQRQKKKRFRPRKSFRKVAQRAKDFLTSGRRDHAPNQHGRPQELPQELPQEEPVQSPTASRWFDSLRSKRDKRLAVIDDLWPTTAYNSTTPTPTPTPIQALARYPPIRA